MQNYRSGSVERLFKAFSLLKTEDECSAFLEDICTITEIRDMAQRLDTALLLDEGKNYQSISKQVGISTATISRVSRCINYGSGGYKTVIDRLKAEEEKK
ncbi:MAG: hypothetical protein IJS65_02730 [Clostridia bacterium]|nr:hypothetical protein [Clostridia bacterium]